MAAPVAIRSQYTDLFGSTMLPVLEELFRAEMQLHPSMRERIFKVVTTDRDIYQTTERHVMELSRLVDVPICGYNLKDSLSHARMQLHLRPKELLKDGKHRRAKEIGVLASNRDWCSHVFFSLL